MPISKYESHPEFSKLPHTAIAAKSLGEPFYYTGKKCTKGHLDVRYASSANCRKCIEERKGLVFNKRVVGNRSEKNQELAAAAYKNGHTTYVPDSPCKNGHQLRFVTTNNCVDCALEKTKKRRKQARWGRIKREYGISEDQYYQLVKKQNSKCKICKLTVDELKFHVDHCHKTKKVRGLLCNKCNQAIGLFNEDPTIIKNAIKYLNAQTISKKRNQITV